MPSPSPVSHDLERVLNRDGETTLGGLIEVFGRKSFALLFVLLLGVPALPLPTGGATHVFEIIAILLAVQLIAGRDHIWLPERWRSLELAGDRQQRFIGGLMRLIRRLEIDFPRIAVAHNGEVLRREEHESTVIRDGDTVEIVRMVGGGNGVLGAGC